MKIITLVGSTKFKDAWKFINALETMKGHLVFSVAMWTHAEGWEPNAEQKKHLDRVHFGKILQSDEVLVLDVDGYIGDSTKAEIEWARLNDKTIHYLSSHHPNWKKDMENFKQTMQTALPTIRYDGHPTDD